MKNWHLRYAVALLLVHERFIASFQPSAIQTILLSMDADSGPPLFWGPSLNMCTVSCAELTASNVETAWKLMEYIFGKDWHT